MGWGTDFTANVYISRQIFKSLADVDDIIEEHQAEILSAELQLVALASATPKYIVPPDWADEPALWITKTVQDLISDIILAEKMITKLELLKENFDTKQDT
jgi:hypothetical protein